MLVITRKVGQVVRIGDDVTVTVAVVKKDNSVRLAIQAPAQLRISRPEPDGGHDDGDVRRSSARVRAGQPEPTGLRDNGPFADAAQARAQYDAQLYGVPLAAEVLGPQMVLLEACLLAGVHLSDYERELLAQSDPDTAMVIAAVLLRSHLAGYRKSRA